MSLWIQIKSVSEVIFRWVSEETKKMTFINPHKITRLISNLAFFFPPLHTNFSRATATKVPNLAIPESARAQLQR